MDNFAISKEEELDVLLESNESSVFVGSFVALLTATYLHDKVDGIRIYFWLFLVLSSGVLRLFVKKMYLKNKENINKWYKVYFFAIVLTASSWASLYLFTLGRITPTQELYIVITELGFAFGGALGHIANMRLAFFYSFSITVTHMIKLVLERNDFWAYLFTGEALFILLIVIVTKKFNKLFLTAKFLAKEYEGKFILEKNLAKEREINLKNATFTSLGEMASGIAHHLNNPLTVISGKARMCLKLIEKNDLERMNSSLEAIISKSHSATHIIQRMQNLTRKKQDEIANEVDINNISNSLKTLIKDDKIEFKEEHTLEHLTYTQEDLYSALSDLVSNSVESLKDKAESEKWIEFKSYAESEYSILEIIDSGNYESIQNPEKIFEPFYSEKDPLYSQGLGLTFCRLTIEKKGGKLELKNHNGHPCFRISIPHSQNQVA